MLPEGADKPFPGLGLGEFFEVESMPLVSHRQDGSGGEGGSTQRVPGSERQSVSVRGSYVLVTTYSVQGTGDALE